VLIGQDGGQSIDLEDGRALFVFSDTLLSARTPSFPRRPPPAAFQGEVGTRGVFLANSGGTSEVKDLRAAWGGIRYYLDATGFPRELLRPTMAERAQGIRFWPEHGVCVEGEVYLYYIGIQSVDPASIWGFRSVGCGLARLDPDTGECERLQKRAEWRLWPRLGADTHVGVQVLRDADHLYVFGSVRDGLFSRAILARVTPERVGDVDAYTYLQSPAPEWSESVADACDLGPCAADYSVSYNAHLGAYLLLYVDPYAKTLSARTAPRVWGPYSEPRRIAVVPHEPTSEMVYLAFEHPGFTPDGGRTVYLSYCQPHFRNNSLLALKFR
jgi:hypothetical protein